MCWVNSSKLDFQQMLHASVMVPVSCWNGKSIFPTGKSKYRISGFGCGTEDKGAGCHDMNLNRIDERGRGWGGGCIFDGPLVCCCFVYEALISKRNGWWKNASLSCELSDSANEISMRCRQWVTDHGSWMVLFLFKVGDRWIKAGHKILKNRFLWSPLHPMPGD
jgi:hypothetical protein